MNAEYSIFKKATKSIEEDYNNVMLQTLCEKLCVNQYQLCRLFKKISGKTFRQYRAETRVKKAVYLLMNSDKLIKEIAYEVGYSNPDYFSQIFKKVMGITPTQFRKDLTKYLNSQEYLELQGLL